MAYLHLYTFKGIPCFFRITESPNQSIFGGFHVYGPLAKLKKIEREEYDDVCERMLKKFNDGDYDDVEVVFPLKNAIINFATNKDSSCPVGKFRFILSQVEHLLKVGKYDNTQLTSMVLKFLNSTNEQFESKLSLDYPMFDFSSSRFKPSID